MCAIRLVAEIDQVVDGQPGAELVVVDDDVDAVELDVTFPYDDRRRVGGGLDERLAGRRDAEQDQPVDPELQERLDRLVLEGGIPLAVADQHAQSVAVQALLQPVEELGVERVVQVGDERADQVGTAFDQAARDRVGPVAELAGRLQHGLPAVLADVRRSAQYERDQRFGDAGSLGDVADGGSWPRQPRLPLSELGDG